MEVPQNISGFVAWFDASEGGLDLKTVETHCHQNAGAARGDHFGIYSNPRRVTPESQTEQQPLVGPHTILAYHGWVGNKTEVAHKLGRPELAGGEDGWLIVAAYEHWGRLFAAHLEGEFALVIFDRTSGRVT